MNEPNTRSGSPRTHRSIGRAVRRQRRVYSARHTGTWSEARCHHPVIPAWTVPTRSDATTAASTHKTSTSKPPLDFSLTFYLPHTFSICTLLLAEKSQPTDVPRHCMISVWQVISHCVDVRPCNDLSVVLWHVGNCLCIIIIITARFTTMSVSA